MAKLSREQRADLVSRARAYSKALGQIADALERGAPVPPCFDRHSAVNPLWDIERTLLGRVDGWKAIAQVINISVRNARRLAERNRDPLPVFHDHLGFFAWVDDLQKWLAVERALRELERSGQVIVDRREHILLRRGRLSRRVRATLVELRKRNAAAAKS